MNEDELQKIVRFWHHEYNKKHDYFGFRFRDTHRALSNATAIIYKNSVVGDIAEFGTESGFTAFCLASGLAINAKVYETEINFHRLPPKEIHLFDSFLGLPDPESEIDLKSPNVKSGRWAKGTFTGLSPDELRKAVSFIFSGGGQDF